MPRLTTLALLATPLLLACSDAPQDAPEPQAAIDRTTVVLIVIDSLRADHLASYGHPRALTPKLDQLAAESTVYTRAYAQAPWTSASIGALLSSRYPSELGMTSFDAAVPGEVTLLPERLDRAGYATGAIVSHPFVGSRWAFDQGFDDFDESLAAPRAASSASRISDLALAWLEAHPGKATFLFLHYADPHHPYEHHEGFGNGGSDETAYESEVAYTDYHVGRVLDALRESDRFDDSLIIVTADHGEAFGEHGQRLHSNSLYDELTRVPLIIRYPSTEPARIDSPIALIDIFPTTLDVLGLRRIPGLRGRSLLGVHNDSGPQPVFLETTFDDRSEGVARTRQLRGVVFGQHKLIAEAGDSQNPGRAELYHLSDDPGETRLLGDTHPAMERLAPMLRRWIEANEERPARQVHLEDGEREQLGLDGCL